MSEKWTSSRVENQKQKKEKTAEINEQPPTVFERQEATDCLSNFALGTENFIPYECIGTRKIEPSSNANEFETAFIEKCAECIDRNLTQSFK